MPKDWIDFREIKEQVRFEPILERYQLRLKPTRGHELSGRCPFHEDRQPSFRVNTEKRIFNCFGCTAKGNVLDFVALKEGVSIKKAAVLVTEWFGLTAAAKSPSRGPQRPTKAPRETSTSPKAPDSQPIKGQGEGNQPLTFTLKLDPTHPYLKERGLNEEIAKFLGLGFCARGVMKGRLGIPIHDAQGNLVAYVGRWPGDELPEGEPKYKLPAGFQKNLVLFNLHRVAGADHLVIVEGYWSVFRLYKLGIPAVALGGCSLSEAQEQLLVSNGTRSLTLLFDGDEAGRQAQAELLPRLARRFFVKVVDLPEGSQPDTLEEAELRRFLA